MDGVLVIDKPAGMTSHDVVAAVRRAIRERRIGHTGTLDPFATGVLPLVVGRATRLASMLSGADKQYEAGIRLGGSTDTYDTTGRIDGDSAARSAADVSWPAPAGITRADVETALGRFHGSFEQTPPRFSAKKIGGVAAYTLARRQQPVSPAAVRVTVSDLSLREYADGLAQVVVTASAGFYVRSLAHDLGQALGCGGHLETLRRTRAARFTTAHAIPLEAIQRDPGTAEGHLIPLEKALPDVPAIRLNERGVKKVSHGNAVGPEEMSHPGTWDGQAPKVCLLGADGALLAIAERRPGGVLQPVVVLV